MAKAEARVEWLINETIKLNKKGVDCVLPKDNPKRYECMGCTAMGKNEFCQRLTQLIMEDM